MFKWFKKKTAEQKAEEEKAYKAEKQRQEKVLENVVDWGDRFNRARYMNEDGK